MCQGLCQGPSDSINGGFESSPESWKQALPSLLLRLREGKWPAESHTAEPVRALHHCLPGDLFGSSEEAPSGARVGSGGSRVQGWCPEEAMCVTWSLHGSALWAPVPATHLSMGSI